jgi:hypothetical protein
MGSREFSLAIQIRQSQCPRLENPAQSRLEHLFEPLTQADLTWRHPPAHGHCTRHVILDERHPNAEDGKFNEELPPDNPNSFAVAIGIVRDFELVEIAWKNDKLILWAKECDQMIKQQHQMSTNEQSNPLVLCSAHLFRWVSAKCRDFHFYRPPRDTPLVFVSGGRYHPVPWDPKWLVVKGE